MKRYVLKIELMDTNIRRRVAVPSGYMFGDLHEIIQIVFGWQGYHMHEFQAAGMLIASDENEDIESMHGKFHYESDVSVDLIMLNVKKLTYVYDYGDWWEHKIKVEKTEESEKNFPELLAFSGTMVAEDCHDGETLMETAKDLEVNPMEINMILEEAFSDRNV